MKVLVAHNRYRSALPSGENAVVEDDISALRSAGVEVLPLIADSDSIPGLGIGGKLGVASGPIFNPAGVARMQRMLSVHRPDVVHVHNVFPLLSPWILRAAHSAGVPVVQTIHNFRQDCVAGTYFRRGTVCTDCVGHRLATPALRHGCYRDSRVQSLPMVLGRSAHKSTWRLVERFLVLTPFHARWLGAQGVPEGRIVVRPTSVPDPGSSRRPGRDVLFAGRLDAEKGIELLLDAWALRNPDGRRLLIAGDGPLSANIRARSEGDPSITFIGPLAPAQVAVAMESAGVIAVPSLWLEGLPRVAVEAMAHGRALLAANQGGLGAVVDSSCGWLVEPSVQAWAEALSAIDDKALVQRGAGARTAFLHRFERTVSTRQLLETYSDVIAP